VTQVQLQVASDNPEAEPDDKPEVSEQHTTHGPEEQQETEIASSEVDRQVEPQTANSVDQSAAVVSTNEADKTPEETVDGELPATESEVVETVEEDDSGDLGDSLQDSSASLLKVRQLRQRVATPGPRRTSSASYRCLDREDH